MTASECESGGNQDCRAIINLGPEGREPIPTDCEFETLIPEPIFESSGLELTMAPLAEPIRTNRDPYTAPASAIDIATIREVTGRLVRALAPERVLLFGSYAWGSPDADSDLDLYLIVAGDAEPAHRIARHGHLALRGLKVPVDLVVRTRSESARNGWAVSSLDYAVLQRGVPL